MLGYTPRVNGYSPGKPIRSSNGPTSSGPYSGRIGSPESVVNDVAPLGRGRVALAEPALRIGPLPLLRRHGGQSRVR